MPHCFPGNSAGLYSRLQFHAAPAVLREGQFHLVKICLQQKERGLLAVCRRFLDKAACNGTLHGAGEQSSKIVLRYSGGTEIDNKELPESSISSLTDVPGSCSGKTHPFPHRVIDLQEEVISIIVSTMLVRHTTMCHILY